jgi:hypothetical protein
MKTLLTIAAALLLAATTQAAFYPSLQHCIEGDASCTHGHFSSTAFVTEGVPFDVDVTAHQGNDVLATYDNWCTVKSYWVQAENSEAEVIVYRSASYSQTHAAWQKFDTGLLDGKQVLQDVWYLFAATEETTLAAGDDPVELGYETWDIYVYTADPVACGPLTVELDTKRWESPDPKWGHDTRGSCLSGCSYACGDIDRSNGVDLLEVRDHETYLVPPPLQTLTFEVNLDTDGDGVTNPNDNCVETYNPAPQVDSDSDGWGNLCDADYGQSGGVGIDDYNILSSAWGSTGDPFGDPVQGSYRTAVDMDSDGGIGIFEWNRLSALWGTTMTDLDCEE